MRSANRQKVYTLNHIWRNPVIPLYRSRFAAFTLVEILLVMAILMILAGLGIMNADKLWGDSQEKAAKLQLDSFATPLLNYRIAMGNYPSTSEGLDALRTAPAGKGRLWKGPYVDYVPVDPWQNPYRYRFPGERKTGSYDLWSMGPDGVDGTEDDIGNWHTESN